MSHFFAYLSRMRLIQRWSLMFNIHQENVQEHSLQVCMIAHVLAIIHNRVYEGNISPEKVALYAMYHDASEVITGDLPTPIKYHSPKIADAYKEIEEVAHQRLMDMLPEKLQVDFQEIFFPQAEDETYWKFVKAADKISAYLKCLEELKAGNQEFSRAKNVIKQAIDDMDMPEVKYFMRNFTPSFKLTLDELD
ncbi:MAG: 5'-deoxynucleotidase [Bacteroidota bacterium]